MDKCINGNLVKRILVFKTRKHPKWVHCVKDCRLLFWKIHRDYWYYWDPRFGTYTEEGMISSLEMKCTFYKDGIVYEKPHVILEFSKEIKESIYFDNDEEMEEWVTNFKLIFDCFIYID